MSFSFCGTGTTLGEGEAVAAIQTGGAPSSFGSSGPRARGCCSSRWEAVDSRLFTNGLVLADMERCMDVGFAAKGVMEGDASDGLKGSNFGIVRSCVVPKSDCGITPK